MMKSYFQVHGSRLQHEDSLFSTEVVSVYAKHRSHVLNSFLCISKVKCTCTATALNYQGERLMFPIENMRDEMRGLQLESDLYKTK